MRNYISPKYDTFFKFQTNKILGGKFSGKYFAKKLREQVGRTYSRTFIWCDCRFQSNALFLKKKCNPKNALMPLMSRIGPGCSKIAFKNSFISLYWEISKKLHI